MKTEIGSEFWNGCTPLTGDGIKSCLPTDMDIRMVLSGRTALELVVLDMLKERPVRSVYIPSYCCHTMIEPFVRHGIDVSFYDVLSGEDGFCFRFDEQNDCDVILFLDYFGFLSDETLQLALRQKQKGKIVIYDATHSVFCNDLNYTAYDYAIASFRKWLPVNAAFCAKKADWNDFPKLHPFTEYENMRRAAFSQKADFAAGKNIEKSGFLKLFADAEKKLDDDYSFYAADTLSQTALDNVNVRELQIIRRKNAGQLIIGIADLSLPWLKTIPRGIGQNDCPLFVPLWIDPERRADFRKYMIDRNIYLPIHWELSPHHTIGKTAEHIYHSVLSCVCDQRYDEQDMKRMIDSIRGYF